MSMLYKHSILININVFWPILVYKTQINFFLRFFGKYYNNVLFYYFNKIRQY